MAAAAEALPRSGRRKKPSQKGKLRHKIAWPRKIKTPSPSPKAAIRKQSSKKKTTKAGDGAGAAVRNPVRRRLDLEEEANNINGGRGGNPLLVVRRRLDLDDDGNPLHCFNRAAIKDNLRSLVKIALGDGVKKPPAGTSASPPPPPEINLQRAFFSRAQLMDNLRSLAKHAAHVVETATADGRQGASKNKKPPGTPASPEIDLRSYCRAQLMENLRSLAAAKHVVHVDTSPTADGGQGAANGSGKSKRKTRRVAKLVLVEYGRKHAAAAADDDDEDDRIVPDDDPIAMALAVRNESAGTEVVYYVPEWRYESVVPPDAKALRQLVRITPAMEAAHNELVRSDETCLGDDLDSVPESPELEDERRRLQVLVDKFMGPVRAIIGKREFANWKGSVLTNVVGTFLTQNVMDVTSSNVFMNIAAKFAFAKHGSNAAQSTNVALLTDGCDLEVSKHCDNDINELIASLRTGEISNWARDKERIRKVLMERLKIPTTVDKISQDIEFFLKNDTSHWNFLLAEAYKNGYMKEETSETIDWEALLHASFGEIEDCIKERGTHSQMTFRILLLLIRIKRDQGSFDLEWLKYIPRAKAKEYLQSIIGIGDKSVACIRLLCLRHRGFPVDVNVARLVTRLGWVPLQPLGDNIEFHMVHKNPVMAKIQKYLEPLLCKDPKDKVYELHCQLITFGKVICTQDQPNCGACPFTLDCKYYKSLFQSARHTLSKNSQDERGKTSTDERIHDAIMVKPNCEHMYQCQIEMGKSTKRHSTEPIIEIPPTPPHEYQESSIEEEYEEQYHEEYEQEYYNIVDMEDAIPCYKLDLRETKPIENATTRLSPGTDMVLIHPRDNPIPIQRRYRLRTEYLAYIIPDGHEILDKFESRVHDDCNPYLFIIRDYDDHTVDATILIPHRTANRGIFALDGTYFQINEVFADHSSTISPIQIKRDILWNFGRCRVYFGTSLSPIARGQTQEGIQNLFHSGYICCREFDRNTRCATILSPTLVTTNTAQTKTGKKRRMPDSNMDPMEGDDKYRA